jgi:hypothetical protein
MASQGNVQMKRLLSQVLKKSTPVTAISKGYQLHRVA